MPHTKDYLWSITNQLVKDYGFSLIYQDAAKPDDTSLNLIKETQGQLLFVRLVPIQYIWPNHLMNDIENIKLRAHHLTNPKSMFSNKIKMFNLYIFENPPNEEIQKIIINHSKDVDKKIEYYFGFANLVNKEIGAPEEVYEELGVNRELFTNVLNQEKEIDPEDVIYEARKLEKRKFEELQGIVNFGKPIFTYLLIAINTVIFLIMTLMGGTTTYKMLLSFGAIEPYLISQGEYWRLFNPIFIHIGFDHFIFNNFAIYIIGRMTERLYGSIRFIFIYLFAGIIGSIASFLILPTTISAGASGAIWGLFGALLYFGLINRQLFNKTVGGFVVPILVINLIFSIIDSSVNIYAHLGGLLGGFIAAALITLPGQKVKKRGLQLVAVFFIIIVVVSMWWGVSQREVKGEPGAIFNLGLEAIESNELDKANQYFSHLVSAYPSEPFHHFYFGNVLLQQGHPEEAKNYYKQAIEIKEDFPEAYYNLALVYSFDKEYDEAISYLTKALELAPDFKEARNLLNEIEKGNNN